MFATVAKINWREELGAWSWFKNLQDKIAQEAFRHPRSYMTNGVSQEVADAFSRLEKAASTSNQNLANMLSWLNFKLQDEHAFEMPFDGTNTYWIRVEEKVFCFKLADEYQGGGSLSQGLMVEYLDKEGDDAFWIDVAQTLEKACRRELEGMDEDFVAEWLNWCE